MMFLPQSNFLTYSSLLWLKTKGDVSQTTGGHSVEMCKMSPLADSRLHFTTDGIIHYSYPYKYIV